LKLSISEARYELELLDIVMNLDFTKPKGKAKQLANELGLDINDPSLIEGF